MPSKDPRSATVEPKPLDRQGMKFATFYVQYRDIHKAAERAKIDKRSAVKTFNRPEVQDEIERQQEAVRAERAKQTVEVEKLSNEFLDRELIKMISNEGGSLKLEAIRLGNVLQNRIQSGNTKCLDPIGDPNNVDKTLTPNVYHALVTVQQEVAPLMPIEPGPKQTTPRTPDASQPPAASAPAAAETKPAQHHDLPQPASKDQPPAKNSRLGGIKIG